MQTSNRRNLFILSFTLVVATFGFEVIIPIIPFYMESLGRIVGPLWAGFDYDINLIFPYISGAAIMVVGFLVSLLWLKEDESVTVAGGEVGQTPSS